MAAQADARLITPSLPRALPPAARKKVEAAIEHHLSAVDALTAFLDECDGDVDAEDTGDLEPSLGSIEGHRGIDQRAWTRGADDDREFADDSAEGDDREDMEDNVKAFELVQVSL